MVATRIPVDTYCAERDSTPRQHEMDTMPGITKRFVDTAEPGRHYDDKLPGLGLYVGTSGARSYFLEYRPGRGRGVHKRRISIGKHGAPWTPQTARDKAIEYLTAVRDGHDPLAEREVTERGRDPARLISTVVDEWLRRDQAGNRPRDKVERLMRREVLPVWGADRSRIFVGGTSLH
jgi:hypothetical protein